MKKMGDRFDGRLLKKLDSMHFIMPLIYPNRCDNEAYFTEIIDLSAVEKYLEKKNENNEGYHYNYFQVFTAAFLKTIMLRPKMNRFIVNGSMYQRKYLSAAFTVKRQFSDSGGEGLAFVNACRADNIDTIHDKIYSQIYEAREGAGGDATETMDIFNRMPRIIGKNVVRLARRLESRGMLPSFLAKGDPYYSSVMLANLGSIGLGAGYHHLTNWGTNSVFAVIGEIKKRDITDANGVTERKLSVDIGLTIDERLADGYYYSKTIKLFKYLMLHPEELENRLDEKP